MKSMGANAKQCLGARQGELLPRLALQHCAPYNAPWATCQSSLCAFSTLKADKAVAGKLLPPTTCLHPDASKVELYWCWLCTLPPYGSVLPGMDSQPGKAPFVIRVFYATILASAFKVQVTYLHLRGGFGRLASGCKKLGPPLVGFASG